MEELKDLREKIDAIDQQMVDLFKQRMEVSKEVAAYKRANGLPPWTQAGSVPCWAR